MLTCRFVEPYPRGRFTFGVPVEQPVSAVSLSISEVVIELPRAGFAAESRAVIAHDVTHDSSRRAGHFLVRFAVRSAALRGQASIRPRGLRPDFCVIGIRLGSIRRNSCLLVGSQRLGSVAAGASWPPDSEVLMSAVTIREMAEVVRRNHFVPVPLDVDPRSLTIRPEQVRERTTTRTKALLIAHLFGSRTPLREVASVARNLGLFVIEDYAQAYAASGDRGDPDADVSLFSFGTIKGADGSRRRVVANP